MDEKGWQFYIDAMRRIIKRMLPNFGGDIVTGLRLIEEELTQSKARIRELERVINWLAEFMVNSDDDITIGEICICYNDPSLDIYMACPICDGNNPLSEALDKARKALADKGKDD